MQYFRLIDRIRQYLNPIFNATFLASTFLITLLLSGCNLPNNDSQVATQASLIVQATIQAQQLEVNAQETSAAGDATRIALDVQSTVIAQQATLLAQQEEDQIQPSPILPTETPQPTKPPPTEPASTENSPTPTPDFETMMKSANILLFEDMAGVYEVRYIKNALNTMGLPYVDVGDASGNFKSQLLSGTEWDLIIAASESRTKIRGEFFVYLNDELNEGTAVIIEHWDLDEIAYGKINAILSRCGIKFQKDWWNPEFPSLWYLVPEHPLFHEPNEGMSLRRYVKYWQGDAGDLIEILPGGKATMLIGSLATEKQRYGTVASCLDDLLIIQTHSSHDYRQEDVERLWQNYIYYALKSHYQSTD